MTDQFRRDAALQLLTTLAGDYAPNVRLHRAELAVDYADQLIEVLARTAKPARVDVVGDALANTGIEQLIANTRRRDEAKGPVPFRGSDRAADDVANGLRKPVDETTPASAGSFTIVSGIVSNIPYSIELRRHGPGWVDVYLHLDGKICGHIPWNNFVKAQMRLDPDHASGPEREIAGLYKELATARAEKYDQVALVAQLREQVAKLEAQIDDDHDPAHP